MEDFTERGISDLRNGVIRTPLLPIETFCNTPLSILRSIRFASRFNFTMDPEMFEAIQDSRPRQALMEKTNYEPRGDEVSKILGGPRPEHSVSLMNKFNILSLLYKIPGSEASHGYPELLQEEGLQQRMID